MSRNVLHAIEESMPSFSKGQKRIAGYILANYDKAAFMTARRLGVIAHVSESTVVRFAVHLGYDGYPSMQKALQELIRGKLTSIQRIQVSHDQMSGGDVLGSVMQRDMNSIHTAIENIDRAEFDRVVGLLLGAEHIYLLGVRSSAFLAGYLNFYMQLLFKNLTLVQSSVSGSIFEQIVQIGPCSSVSAFRGTPKRRSMPCSTRASAAPRSSPSRTAACRRCIRRRRLLCSCAAT